MQFIQAYQYTENPLQSTVGLYDASSISSVQECLERP